MKLNVTNSESDGWSEAMVFSVLFLFEGTFLKMKIEIALIEIMKNETMSPTIPTASKELMLHYSSIFFDINYTITF